MANEIQVRSSLQVNNGNLRYQSQPTAFTATQNGGAKGPTPGMLSVSTTGTDVDLSQLSTPGVCRIMNLDDTNYIEWGIHDGSLFHPIGEALPGESYVIRFSRNLGEEESVPGTGTTAVLNAFYLRANTGTCQVLVEAFEQ